MMLTSRPAVVTKVPDQVEESAEGSDLEYGIFVGLSLLGNSD
jgi:hypothetical protein